MISAFELAEDATRVNVTLNDYSVVTQTRVSDEDCATALTMTYNGTQTFNASGKAFDSDHDK